MPSTATKLLLIICALFQPTRTGAFPLSLQRDQNPIGIVATTTNYAATDSAKHGSKTFEQSVAFGRAMEISSILLSEVFIPLVASMAWSRFSATDPSSFWSLQNRHNTTNAQRVCRALEALGPTYVKFGQALASRADLIPPTLADTLLRLQDDMDAFPSTVAKEIIRDELSRSGEVPPEQLATFLESLSKEPVAAASIGQVFKGYLEEHGEVAVKVKRPGIQQVVERDAALLRAAAYWVESLPGWKTDRLIAARVVDAVDEFMERIFEELDYQRELSNMKTFGDLYSLDRGTCKHIRVVVPNPIDDYCTENVIVMEWINGTKLDNFEGEDADKRKDDLAVVEMGITATLSQLLETGKLHADPHLGNLRRVETPDGVRLGYIDFGLLADVPETVRDGLVCAVVQLVFARNVKAVAALFGDLQLLPPEVMNSSKQMKQLAIALDQILNDVLLFPANGEGRVPSVRFDKLLGSLISLVSRFQLTLPPYFLNNARALATLEGVALRLDPSFNVLQVVYPFALSRLLRNPSLSQVVATTTIDLLKSPTTGLVELRRGKLILNEIALLTGFSRRRVLYDVLSTKGGRRTTRKAIRMALLQRWEALRGTKKSLS